MNVLLSSNEQFAAILKKGRVVGLDQTLYCVACERDVAAEIRRAKERVEALKRLYDWLTRRAADEDLPAAWFGWVNGNVVLG